MFGVYHRTLSSNQTGTIFIKSAMAACRRHHKQVCRLLSITQKRKRWENLLDSHPRLQLLPPALVCDFAPIMYVFRASGGARVYKLYKVN